MKTTHDFDKTGFMEVPNFLSKSEISMLMDEYKKGSQKSQTARFDAVIMLSKECQKFFEPKLLELANSIGSKNLKVDMISQSFFVESRFYIESAFHTDLTYYAEQDHINNLNFWIPLQKPDRNKTGVRIIPLDRLAQADPELARETKGRGAFIVLKNKSTGKLFIYDGDKGVRLERAGNLLEEIAYSPAISAGDLLMWRQDVLHATQDNDTNRVAVTLRVCNSKSMISRAKLLGTSIEQFTHIGIEHEKYRRKFAAFELTGKDELPRGELDSLLAAIEGEENIRMTELNVKKLTVPQFTDLVYDLKAKKILRRVA